MSSYESETNFQPTESKSQYRSDNSLQEKINGRDFKEIWNSNEFTQLERENILLHSIQERMLDKNTFNGELFAGINSKLGKLELSVVDNEKYPFLAFQKQIYINPKIFLKYLQNANIENVDKYLDLTVSEELIHVLTNYFTSLEDIKKIATEINPNNFKYIQSIYKSLPSGDFELGTREYLRMIVQQEILGTTTEKIKYTKNGVIDSIIDKIWNFLYQIFKDNKGTLAENVKKHIDFIKSNNVDSTNNYKPDISQVETSLSQDIKYQLSKEQSKGIIASEKTIRDLAARMSDRIGIPVRYISDRSQQFKGKLENGTAVINLAYATLDTPIHEILGHPIIRAIKNRSQNQEDSSFNKLYENLLEELSTTKRGKEVLDRIKRDYNLKDTKEGIIYFSKEDGKWKVVQKNKGVAAFDTEQSARDFAANKYTLEEQQEEAIVELLGLMTAEKLDNVKDGKLISLLKRLLKEMKQFIRSLINQKEVEIDKLPDNMTLGDLSDLLAYSNSKLILPGYEVEYTTPDNQQFKTYAEASNHISELAKSVEDVDLDNIQVEKNESKFPQDFYKFNGTQFTDIDNKVIRKNENGKWQIEQDFGGDLGIRWVTIDSQDAFERYNEKYGRNNSILGFIEKNKEYEQSKEIIEEWKKVNNIQYNPEEIYSRGQEFSSVVGAYSSFDVNLMMQNLLSHIEDNEKAGGKFAISAYTKPIDKQIGHLEGGGGKIKFKLYPQSNDILWAANVDVYSGSVWDASEKVNKDKKSELLGVSYTKYPSLSNVNAVQPNLASIVEDLSHHHNELGIVLTGSNFRLEYDDNIPYQTKKIIDSINSILDQKYGKLVTPEIKRYEGKIVKYGIFSESANDILEEFKTKEEAQKKVDEINNLYWYKGVERAVLLENDTYRVILTDSTGADFIANNGVSKEFIIEDFGEEFGNFLLDYKPRIANIQPDYRVVPIKEIGVQPTQTNETLKESIESVQSKLKAFLDYYVLDYDGNNWVILGQENEFVGSWKNKEDAEKELNKLQPKDKSKEYTEQALINTKIAKLKEVAKKYPRSLIRSEVRRSFGSPDIGFENDELPFQKIPNSLSKEQSDAIDNVFDENPELADAVYESLEYSYTGEYSPAFLYESGIKASDGLGYVTYKVKVNNKGDKYLTSLDKTPNTVEKNMGVKAYYKFIIENKGKNITTDNELSIAGRKVLEQLEKEGYVTKTDAKIIENKKSGSGYDLNVYDKPLYEFTGKIPESYLTPQQKQQALQQYSSYISTIFPESKVKDIVYRGAKKGIEEQKQTTYWTFRKRLAETFKTHGVMNVRLRADEEGQLYIAIVDVKNPIKTMDISNSSLKEYKQEGKDAAIVFPTPINPNTGKIFEDFIEAIPFIDKNKNSELVVFESEQIHILGSKQDIEGFKEFINNNNQKTEDYFSNEINKIQEESKIIENSLKEYETSKKIDNRNTTKAIKNKEEKTKETNNKLLSLGFEFINENEYQFSTSSYITFKSKLNSLDGINVLINTFKSPDYLIKIKIAPLKNNFDLQKQGELPFNPIELKLALKENDFIQDIADNTFEGLTEEQINILRDNLENGELNLNCKI